MENCVFIDIFTTQNDLYGKNNCPIQFCCEIFSNLEIFDKEKFFKPERRKMFNIIPDEDILIPGYITSGYKNSDILTSDFNGMKLKDGLEIIYRLFKTFKEKDFFIIGYNHINYDIEILNRNLKRVLNVEPIEFKPDHLIDVMKLSEIAIPIDLIGSYSMDSVLTYLIDDCQKVQNLRINKSTANDIKLTKLILLKLIKENETFSEIVSEINKPYEVKIMNFGKYKGADIKMIFETDKQYCNWLIKNKDITRQNPNLVNTIKKLLNTVIE